MAFSARYNEKPRIVRTELLQGSNEHIVAVALLSVLTPKVAAQPPEFAPRYVHTHPCLHILQVPEERLSSLARRER